MHRRDLLGDVFGDKANPSNQVLAASLRRIQAEGHGVVVYLRPEGTGEGCPAPAGLDVSPLAGGRGRPRRRPHRG